MAKAVPGGTVIVTVQVPVALSCVAAARWICVAALLARNSAEAAAEVCDPSDILKRVPRASAGGLPWNVPCHFRDPAGMVVVTPTSVSGTSGSKLPCAWLIQITGGAPGVRPPPPV